jgi:hypothetical protein
MATMVVLIMIFSIALENRFKQILNYVFSMNVYVTVNKNSLLINETTKYVMLKI